MHYAVVDIGSPKQGNLGWWITGPFIEDGGTGPDDMIANLTEAVRLGPVILGFEAPMYVPAKRDIRATIQQRPGEAGRPWSAGAGASVTAMALALVPAILDRVASNIPGVRAWQDWTRKPESAGEIMVFEAFVTTGVSDGHAQDAKLAAYAARELLSGTRVASAVGQEPCMSMLGAALLHAGMSHDTEELRRQCLVVKLSKTKSAGLNAGVVNSPNRVFDLLRSFESNQVWSSRSKTTLFTPSLRSQTHLRTVGPVAHWHPQTPHTTRVGGVRLLGAYRGRRDRTESTACWLISLPSLLYKVVL